MTLKRVLPYYEKEIAPRVEKGEKVLIAAHGNSLRSIIKHLEGLSGEEIVNTELATGVPIVYKLDKSGAQLSYSPFPSLRLTRADSQARSSRRTSSTTSPSRRALARARDGCRARKCGARACKSIALRSVFCRRERAVRGEIRCSSLLARLARLPATLHDTELGVRSEIASASQRKPSRQTERREPPPRPVASSFRS